MVKGVIISLSLIVFLIPLLSAIDLDVSSESILNSYIVDLEEPAIFDLTITNNEESDDFKIYSIVGIDIFPDTVFRLEEGVTKVLKVELTPQNPLRKKKGFLPFEYRIENSKGEIQTEQLVINIIELNDVISISLDNVNPDSEEVTLSIKNEVAFDFKDIQLSSKSAFFDYKRPISLKPFETKELVIPVDKEGLKILVSGNYLVNTVIEVNGITAEIESLVNFVKQENIETSESREGIFIKKYEISKINTGNVPKKVEISTEKNLISYLFTTFNTAPETSISGFTVSYQWVKELTPNEEFNVVIRTNWLFPLIIVVFIILSFILIKRNVESSLILRKDVSFVKTKGGEFALKITLRAKAKEFIERINIIDKLPPLVKLYERYGTIAPSKVDEKNRRLEWNIESLNKGEERIFSYIIYSKIGIVGRFELPIAKAIYEKEEKIKEAESNKAFYQRE